MKLRTRLALCVLAALAVAIVAGPLQSRPAAKQPDPKAVARARKTVKMLDDIYKTAIVLITKKYVKTKEDFPAGAAAVRWFKAISDKGWPKVRIIDVSGQPYDSDNVAKDRFEKEAVRQLKAGKQYFEKIEQVKGKPVLRAATFIPVVLDRCVMCHPNYKDAPKGAAIGALTYTVPIE